MSGIYPIDSGGPASVAYFLAKELGRLENEITLFVRAKTRKQCRDIEEELKELKNVKTVTIQLNPGLETLLNIPQLASRTNKAMRNFNSKEFDIIHYNSPPDDVTLLFPLFAKLKRVKQTFAIHGGLFYESKITLPGGLFYESKDVLKRLLIKSGKKWFNKIIVLNNFSERLALNAGFEKDRIVTIPNGIDLETIGGKIEPLELQGEPKILYVGRLAKIKGVEVLLRSFLQIVGEFPSATLYIVGEGPESKTYKELTQRLGLQKHVYFTGFIPKTTDVYRYYKSVDLLVLPSYRENFSITLLEAMGSKVPIIASDAEGNKEVIRDGENGLIFSRGNWKALAEKMLFLISNKDVSKELVDKGYEMVEERYNWRKIGLEYHGLFQSLL